MRGADQDERNGGSKAHKRCQQATPPPGCGIADHRHREDHGPGGDLAEGDGSQKLAVGQPAVGHDRVVLHERDDDEPATVRQCPDLERHPGKGEQAACARPHRSR